MNLDSQGLYERVPTSEEEEEEDEEANGYDEEAGLAGGVSGGMSGGVANRLSDSAPCSPPADSDTAMATSCSTSSCPSPNGSAVFDDGTRRVKTSEPTARQGDPDIEDVPLDPGHAGASTLKLIAAIDALRCVIADSTAASGFQAGACPGGTRGGAGGGVAAAQGPSRSRHQNAAAPAQKKPVPGFSIPGQEFGQGQRTSDVPMKMTKAMSLKDDRLKIRKEKVIVELRVVFLKIGEIDTLKEQYSADTFMQAKWREPLLDGKSLEELRLADLDRFWNPLLFIDNILSESKEATWLTATSNHKGEAYVIERRRVRGVFMENLELDDFPLDVQDLTVTLTTERPDTEIDIIPDENEMSGINVQTFVDQQEWKLHEHIEVSRKVMTQEYSSSNRCHPALSVTCRAARRPGYFYWNVFLVMFFISALSFATFAVSPELPQNRLQLSFTLLLTSVTFKFVINQSLPKISYLTYMDKYVLLSLIILCVVCIWHAVATVFVEYGPVFVKRLEWQVFLAFVVIYLLCHAVFIFWLYFDACKRRRLMKHKDHEYLDFLRKKQEWLAKSKEYNSCSRRQSTMLLHSTHVI